LEKDKSRQGRQWGAIMLTRVGTRVVGSIRTGGKAKKRDHPRRPTNTTADPQEEKLWIKKKRTNTNKTRNIVTQTWSQGEGGGGRRKGNNQQKNPQGHLEREKKEEGGKEIEDIELWECGCLRLEWTR